LVLDILWMILSDLSNASDTVDNISAFSGISLP